MRLALTWMLAFFISGCFSRGKPDLLQARLREQQERVVEVEKQMAMTQSELERARRDAEQLRAELNRSGKQVIPAEYRESLLRVHKLVISSLVSGGLNRDDKPGDDAIVALISLIDDDSETVKLPGVVDLTLLDPALPEPSRQVGQWHFTLEECRAKWTRGFTGTGYQFTVPLDRPVQHSQLVLHAKLTAADGRPFDASQMIRVTPPNEGSNSSPMELPAAPLDDINDPPPPAVLELDEAKPEEWDGPAKGTRTPLRESSSFKKDLFPQRY